MLKSVISYFKRIFKREEENLLLLEIERNKAALTRYYNEIDKMNLYWRENEMPCCPSCAFGSDYSYYLDKIEKVEYQIERLKKKRTNLLEK